MPSADIDSLAINTIRTLAADVVQKSNSGHPGAPMGCAPMAHVLFSKFVKASPSNPKWIGRDRFVLSNGHGCALQYILYHLLGYKISMDDLKSFRQLDSNTPGHPEAGLTDGIEVSTGPLGQGISNAVGLAAAEAHMAATFNKPGFDIIDNYTYCITGDGCLQEGVQAEAVSLAGHLQLGKLIVLYDDNHVSIDGDTDVSFTEDVTKRFEAYGWHTQILSDGDHDLAGLASAISKAQTVKDKPSIIKIRTTIGFASKHQGTEKVHGAPLGNDDVAQVKSKLGFDPSKTFFVPQEVYDAYAGYRQKGEAKEREWNDLLAKYQKEHPQLASELLRRFAGKLPDNWKSYLPKYSLSDSPVGTRKLSEQVINKIADIMPEFFGGSADLTGSNLTRWKTAIDFQPPSTKLGSYAGRYVRFGVREHGMAAICNGLAAYGGLIPFGATFLNFISYALGAVRLSALSHHHVLYIMTHDSIGLGEDGPTHQPIETLASLRALPNLTVFRPCDGNETVGAYIQALERSHGPHVLCLSRQNVPNIAGTSVDGVSKGAYILEDKPDAQIILTGTGTEVVLLVEAAKELAKSNIKVRLVSHPSWELFDQQPLDYKLSVYPDGIPVLSVEALCTLGWERYAHASMGVNTFGASAPYAAVYKKFGLTSENIAEKAKKVIAYYQGKQIVSQLRKPF